MQRLKLLALVAMAVLVVSAMTGAAAYAGVEALNAEGKATAFTLTGNSEKESRMQVLGNSLEVKCGKTVSEGSLEATGKLGSFHLAFEKCTTSLGGTCTGVGDAAGVILALGTLHLASNVGLTVGYILFLFGQFHLECNPLGIKALFLVKGAVLCQISPINTLTTSFTVKCKNNGTVGDPETLTYENDKGETATLSAAEELLSAENTGEFKMATWVGELTFTVTPAVKLDI